MAKIDVNAVGLQEADRKRQRLQRRSNTMGKLAAKRGQLREEDGYVICPPDEEGEGSEDDEILFGLHMTQTDDPHEAETEFNSYISNFLGELA